jgi:hypothetical protein
MIKDIAFSNYLKPLTTPFRNFSIFLSHMMMPCYHYVVLVCRMSMISEGWNVTLSLSRSLSIPSRSLGP